MSRNESFKILLNQSAQGRSNHSRQGQLFTMSPTTHKSLNRMTTQAVSENEILRNSYQGNPVLLGNMNTINMLQKFQKNIIDLATQITQINEKGNIGNLSSGRRHKSHKNSTHSLE